MADDKPFEDIEFRGDGFSIPDLKWRELVFVGAVRPEGDSWVRDPARPVPPFKAPGLFPEGVRFRIQKEGGRVVVLADEPPRPGQRRAR
jgi:hypothetical protein